LDCLADMAHTGVEISEEGPCPSTSFPAPFKPIATTGYAGQGTHTALAGLNGIKLASIETFWGPRWRLLDFNPIYMGGGMAWVPLVCPKATVFGLTRNFLNLSVMVAISFAICLIIGNDPDNGSGTRRLYAESTAEPVFSEFTPHARVYHLRLPRLSSLPSVGVFRDFSGSNGIVGVALNSVPLMLHHTDGSSTYEFDSCGGHADLQGTYHYHLPPLCLLRSLGSAVPAMGAWWVPGFLGAGAWPRVGLEVQVGWALDGVPIYGPYRAGRLVHSSELDQCHGAISEGEYRYFVTPEPPFLPPCLRGAPQGFEFQGPRLGLCSSSAKSGLVQEEVSDDSQILVGTSCPDHPFFQEVVRSAPVGVRETGKMEPRRLCGTCGTCGTGTGSTEMARDLTLIYQISMDGFNAVKTLVAFVLAGFIAQQVNKWQTKRGLYGKLVGRSRDAVMKASCMLQVEPDNTELGSLVKDMRMTVGRHFSLAMEFAILKARGAMDDEAARTFLEGRGLLTMGEWDLLVPGDRHTTVYFWILCACRQARKRGIITDHEFTLIAESISNCRGVANDLLDLLPNGFPFAYTQLVNFITKAFILFIAINGGFTMNARWRANPNPSASFWIGYAIMLWACHACFQGLLDLQYVLHNPFLGDIHGVPHENIVYGQIGKFTDYMTTGKCWNPALKQ